MAWRSPVRYPIGIAVLISLFCGQVCAVPDQSLTIAPAATNNTTISSSDENDRNNDVSTTYNAHSHVDITAMSSVNTFTIGDNAVGNKTYAVDTDQANMPGLRYNTSVDFWTLSNDGANYLASAHAETTDGLLSGSMIYGGNGVASGAIVSLGRATTGQVVMGRTDGTPILASVAWQWIESLDTSSGTTVTSATLPTDSDLFMVVFENVRGTAADVINFIGIDNSLSIEGSTLVADASDDIAVFGTGPQAVNGTLYVPRLATNSTIICTGSVSYATGTTNSTLLRCEDTGSSNFTTLQFTTATGFSAGKIHIYKSVPS